MKRVAQALAFPLALAVALFAMAACGKAIEGDGPSEDGYWSEVRVPLDDGRTVVCLDGGNYEFSCDWENAK